MDAAEDTALDVDSKHVVVVFLTHALDASVDPGEAHGVLLQSLSQQFDVSDAAASVDVVQKIDLSQLKSKKRFYFKVNKYMARGKGLKPN